MTDGDGEDEAARAFESLRAEVSLMRRAVERLAAERGEVADTPDYSETLGVIAASITATAQRVDALAKSPALSLQPQEVGRQITAVAFDARREDHRLFVAAKQGMDEVATRLRHHLQSHVEAGAQRRRLWQAGLAGIAAGMALWAIFAGPIARSLPASWLLPERMAARSLRLSMWESGQRLMHADDAQTFAGVQAADRLATANRETLNACRKQVARAGKAVRCTIEVGRESRMADDAGMTREALVALIDRTLRAEARTDAPPVAERGDWLHGSLEPLAFTDPDPHGWMAIRPAAEPPVWMPRALVMWQMAMTAYSPVVPGLAVHPAHSLARWPEIDVATRSFMSRRQEAASL